MSTLERLAQTAYLPRKLYLGAALTLLTSFFGLAMASETAITARFLPDSNNPEVNNFVNTTPNSGYCVTNPGDCNWRKAFSVAVPNVTEYIPLISGQGVGFKVPNSWRELTVTHDDGTTQKVQVRIVGIGSRYNLSQSVDSITGVNGSTHSWLWDREYVYAPAGCSYGGLGFYSQWNYTFFWGVNSDNPCAKFSRVNVSPGMFFSVINFMYEMRTPNPLDMSMGTYKGQITYTLGPGGDFDLGGAVASDPLITLNFTLSVQHNLRVQFPINANLLALAPQGGWQQWVYNGAANLPPKLIGNQPFQQWSSTHFKMQLQCQYALGSDCAIQNDAGTTQVPVKTMVTLPYGLRDGSNKPVNRYPLANDTPSIFHPTRYVSDERSHLHFEVDKQGVQQMVDSGGGRFRGDVTVIWDSEIY
ncbi:MAG: hypothetical protein AAGC84_10900 [Pseudomonas sp.]